MAFYAQLMRSFLIHSMIPMFGKTEIQRFALVNGNITGAGMPPEDKMYCAFEKIEAVEASETGRK